MLFDGIGPAGQARLAESSVVIVGCGALGTTQAEILSRAGIGKLTLIDRDFVESSNLQRQVMFTEQDAEDRLPKAVACANHIAQINSAIKVEPVVADINNSNVERLVNGADLVVDGTDNFVTRYLINDACVKLGISWIYGAAVGSYGATMSVRPTLTPCLRCVFEEQPAPGTTPTCDTAGVIMPIISIVAATQCTEAIKILLGKYDLLHNSLMQFDVWQNEWRRIRLGNPADNCPACVRRDYRFLNAELEDFAGVLCGRDAVQITPKPGPGIELNALAERLRGIGEVRSNDYLLRFQVGNHELTIFRDARAIIRGTTEIGLARSLYARYVGS